MLRSSRIALTLAAAVLVGCGGGGGGGGSNTIARSPSTEAGSATTGAAAPSSAAPAETAHVCDLLTVAEASQVLGVSLVEKSRDTRPTFTECKYSLEAQQRVHLSISAQPDKRYDTTLFKYAEVAPRRHRPLTGVGRATEGMLNDLDEYYCEAAARYKLPDPKWGDYLWLRIEANAAAVKAGFQATVKCEEVLRLLADRISWTPSA